jgi:arginyl-tRNA synthetase
MTTREWSTKKFEALFKELGVKHDAVFFEKDIKATGQGIVDDLLKRGIATVGDGGAIIVDLSEYGLDVALVRKSNGVGLYLTSDLPLAELKFKKFAVDESIVITGQEQTFYFRQLYKILELMGFKKKLTHINYGLVTLPEGKMSSRTGNVILYEDLRDTVLESLLATTREHHPEWPDKKIHATAKALTMAALKFDMQKHEANKNIVFDTKEATSVEGFSGPYVLYAIARINSIVKKVGEMNGEPDFSLLTAPQEKELAVMLGNFGSVTQKALEQYNPSVIARYAFDTAKAFNDFYNTCSIAGAETEALKQARLALALAAKQGLINTLTLLSISPVEEM